MTLTTNAVNANSNAPAVPEVMKVPIEINDVDLSKLQVVYSGNPDAPILVLYPDPEANEAIKQVLFYNQTPTDIPFGASWFKDKKKNNAESGKIDMMATLERPQNDPRLKELFDFLEEKIVECLFANATVLFEKPKSKEIIREEYFGGLTRTYTPQDLESDTERVFSFKIPYIRRENYVSNYGKWKKQKGAGAASNDGGDDQQGDNDTAASNVSEEERNNISTFPHSTVPWRNIFTTRYARDLRKPREDGVTEEPMLETPRAIPYYELPAWRNCKASVAFSFDSSRMQKKVFVKMPVKQVEFCDPAPPQNNEKKRLNNNGPMSLVGKRFLTHDANDEQSAKRVKA